LQHPPYDNDDWHAVTAHPLQALAQTARAWPFEEARKLVERFAKAPPTDGVVLFETGYGPSGLPHIGTFGEVARTTMVRHAFSLLSDLPTRLVCFSDDMDGLRKVPDNVPNKDMLTPHLGKPLTQVPDPFGKFESFAHHNNAMLRDFLDRFDFDYEFLSATDCYKSGRFDATLLRVLAQYEAVKGVIVPTLGPDRRATYSPFLPVCPKTGVVLQVPTIAQDAAAGTISYIDPGDGETMTVPVTGGHCKLQWKVDWAMRWVALGVDYEMAGKDLIDSVTLSSKIARVLGARPPEGFNYELFLDEKGEKISKSKGNGLTIEDWLTYASPESLSLYMFQSPRKAKRLYFDIIPKTVDEYYQHVAGYAELPADKRLESPAWHIHAGDPTLSPPPVSFALLLNLVAAANSPDPAVLWGFVSRYAPEATPQTQPELDRLIGYALAYYRDFVAPTRKLRVPTDQERAALDDLTARLSQLTGTEEAEAIQYEVYEVGKAHGWADNLRGWFQALYEVLLGTSQGPRMGSFIKLYGLHETRTLIAAALRREA
jgi:lysyl-tRNA synthetase, class I